MLTYIEFVVIFIVAIIFLKPKDIIYLLSFLKEMIIKFKHILHMGKQEINKIIDETTISDLKKQSESFLKEQSLKETKQYIDNTKSELETKVTNLYKSTNLNYNLDNILNNNTPTDQSKTNLDKINKQKVR